MRILVMGAHPDDPESGCGGLALRAVGLGHEVHFVYLTSGNPQGAPGPREQEAEAACRIIGAKPHFLRYPDPGVPLDVAAAERLHGFLRELQPGLVLAQWPVDTHPDHQATGGLAIRAVGREGQTALGFYEVLTGRQTIGMAPNRYVDISEVAGKKKQAVECHVSQRVPDWYPVHEEMERFRGLELGVERAEGYYLWRRAREAEELFVRLVQG